MDQFTVELFLPAQAAAETEATIVSWQVGPGDTFTRGQILAEAESAKSTFTFEAPCGGTVAEILAPEAATVPFEKPVIRILTADASMKATQPAPAESLSPSEGEIEEMKISGRSAGIRREEQVSILGIGGYLPRRVVTNLDLLGEFPGVTEEYIFGVTGIRERRWAEHGEKPSDMAYRASLDALRKSGLKVEDIGAIVLSTTTPDVVMPATACILQEKLGIRGIPAFDLNAACSGWLYGICVAKGLVVSGIADNVLVVAVDMQSRVLDKSDKNTYFLFGDGAGAAVVSATGSGHRILHEIMAADSKGLNMARRHLPGYEIPGTDAAVDPWIRLEGRALFKFATEHFSSMVREVSVKSGWAPEEVAWVVPHQANGRILKAAAERSGVAFERFYINIDRVGNTSSASIPIALTEVEKFLRKGDKIVLCTVGAGVTAAAMSLEW